MLSDRELQQAAAQLQEFQSAAKKHAETNSEVLEKYARLMEDYQRLRSDYEEERENREKYKQLAKGQERNPFVLVLIDGDGYVFDDDLVSSGAEGGQRAAQLLNTAVKESLNERGLGHCKIMVRIYANLSGVSKALSKSKLAGPEKRSLAPFVANFNRSNELFDFVDAGELKENADFKIRSLFHLYAENAQCKHIFFAACHDVGYINELNPYTSARDRITLVRTNASFHREFAKLGLRIEDFRNVFRNSPLDPLATTPSTFHQSAATSAQKQQSTASTETSSNVCHFWQKGNCRYGGSCKNLHVSQRNNTNSIAPPLSTGLADIRDWRKDASPNKPTLPMHMPSLVKSDNDFMSGHTPSPAEQFSVQQAPIPHMGAVLPKEEDVPPGKIPVNREQHRIDYYIEPSTYDDRAQFNARKMQRKLCNNHHLKGYCSSSDACPYDHSPITEGVKNHLREVARGMPCPRKGACRDPACFQGHICQTMACTRRGGKVFCKLPAYLHDIDLTVAGYVDGISKPANGVDALFADTKSSSSPTPSTTQDSDGEGAALGEGSYTTTAASD